MTNDLVERVALAFCNKVPPCKMCRNDAKRAVTIALEEAAKRVWRYSEDGKFAGQRDTDLCNHLAAAIRAMIPSGNAPAQNDDADSK